MRHGGTDARSCAVPHEPRHSHYTAPYAHHARRAAGLDDVPELCRLGIVVRHASGTYLTSTLHFSGTETGAVFGTTALASMISPFFVGMIADRFFATEKVLAALHLVGRVPALRVTQVTSFGAVYAHHAGVLPLLLPDHRAHQFARAQTYQGRRQRPSRSSACSARSAGS